MVLNTKPDEYNKKSLNLLGVRRSTPKLDLNKEKIRRMLKERKGEFMELMQAFGVPNQPSQSNMAVKDFKACLEAFGIHMTA